MAHRCHQNYVWAANGQIYCVARRLIIASGQPTTSPATRHQSSSHSRRTDRLKNAVSTEIYGKYVMESLSHNTTFICDLCSEWLNFLCMCCLCCDRAISALISECILRTIVLNYSDECSASTSSQPENEEHKNKIENKNANENRACLCILISIQNTSEQKKKKKKKKKTNCIS